MNSTYNLTTVSALGPYKQAACNQVNDCQAMASKQALGPAGLAAETSANPFLLRGRPPLSPHWALVCLIRHRPASSYPTAPEVGRIRRRTAAPCLLCLPARTCVSADPHEMFVSRSGAGVLANPHRTIALSDRLASAVIDLAGPASARAVRVCHQTLDSSHKKSHFVTLAPYRTSLYKQLPSSLQKDSLKLHFL